MKIRKFVPIGLALVSLASPAQSAVLQSFAGPTVVSGGGTGTLLVDTTTDTGNWLDAYISGTAPSALYYQFTLEWNALADPANFFGGLHLYSSGGERFLVGSAFGNTGWSAFNQGDSVIGNRTLNANPVTGGANQILAPESATFVVKLEQATNTATVWFNPNLSTTEVAQDNGITTVITGLGNGDTFDSVRLRAGNNTTQATYSNITFRNDTPFTAVPEPSYPTLLGSIGALALLFRRR